MKQEFQSRCELFIENRNKLKKVTKDTSSYIYPVAANVLASRNAAADMEKLTACKKLMKEKFGVFSNFRGNAMLPFICMLSMEENPEDKLDRAALMYEKLKAEFFGSEFLALAAMILTDMVSVAEADPLIRRGKEIYKLMKKEHPLLTGAEDSVFAVLLAFSSKCDKELVLEMEQVYDELKKDGFAKDSTQFISHLFALTDGDHLEKCAKLREVLDKLKSRDRKYGKYYEMGILAGLALLPVEAETLVQDMLEIDEYLSGQKGYTGLFKFEKKTRLMHAAMILSGLYNDGKGDRNVETGAITGTIAMVAAEQAVLCAVIGASMAIHTSSSSTSTST